MHRASTRDSGDCHEPPLTVPFRPEAQVVQHPPVYNVDRVLYNRVVTMQIASTHVFRKPKDMILACVHTAGLRVCAAAEWGVPGRMSVAGRELVAVTYTVKL